MISDTIVAHFKELGATRASHTLNNSDKPHPHFDNFYFWNENDKEIGYVSSLDTDIAVVWPQPKHWVKANKQTQKFYELGER